MSSIIRKYLIIKASGDVRLATRKPNHQTLNMDEIAVPVVIHIPDGWQQVVADQIDIHMPNPPSVEPINPESIVAGEPDEEEESSS